MKKENQIQNANDRSHLLCAWSVLYGPHALKFECQAEDVLHAIEQCRNAYPDDKVVSASMDEVVNPTFGYWNSTRYSNDTLTSDEFQLDIANQLKSNGQMYIDFGPVSGEVEDILALSIEVNRLPGSECDVQCLHIHAGTDNLLFSLFKNGEGVILRPESEVSVCTTKLPNGELAYSIR
jgi:hypothetical protein